MPTEPISKVRRVYVFSERELEGRRYLCDRGGLPLTREAYLELYRLVTSHLEHFYGASHGQIDQLKDRFAGQERSEARLRAKRLRTELAARYDTFFKALAERDGALCATCGRRDNLQIDHIVPLIRGGDNDLSNLQLLCAPCNLVKSDKTTEATPRRPEWRS